MQTRLPLTMMLGAGLLPKESTAFVPVIHPALSNRSPASQTPNSRLQSAQSDVEGHQCSYQRGGTGSPLVGSPAVMRDSSPQNRLTDARFFNQSELQSFLDTHKDDPNHDWMVQANDQFSGKLRDKTFPCPFGRLTHRKDAQQLIFVNQDSPQGLAQLREQIIEWTEFVKQDDAMFRPLVIFFKPEACNKATDYHQKGWEILQYLHDNDPASWPADTASDPEHHLWSFCFNGIQISVNISNPAQLVRQARNLGDGMVMVFNPRKDFDMVAGNTKGGRETRKSIRAALARYEGQAEQGKKGAPSDLENPNNLGMYGDPNNLEWRQYAASEENMPLPSKCPFTH